MPAYLYAQCENTARTYANFQGSYRDGLGLLNNPLLWGTIADATNAVNGQVKDASTLSVGLGLLGLASTTQFLEFTSDGTNASPRLIAANTPVTIKISLPTEVLSLLSGIEIGTFTGLTPVAEHWPSIIGPGNFAGFNSSSKNVIYNAGNIAGVISGSGETEITITPTQAYNGIYVKLSGNALSVALSTKLFHAYIMELSTGSIDCDEVIDVLSGVKPTIIGGVLNASGKVYDPFSAIDKDQNSSALMDVGASVLNQIFLTAIFNKPSQPADSVSIILQKPGGGLLDLNLLTGFVIQPYLNGTKAGAAFDNTNTFLNLKLLPGAADKYVLTFPITEVYDRLEISTGGLTGVLGSLRIYEIKRKLARPRTLVDPSASDSKVVCQGQSASYTVQSAQACTEYKWYDAAGLLVATGMTFISPNNLAPGEYSYFVRASRTYCVSAVSDPLEIKLKVNPLPPLNIPGETICSGTSTILKVAMPDEGIIYNWYNSSPASGLPFNIGKTFTTPILSATTSYYVMAIDKLTGCINAGGAKIVTVRVRPIAVVSPLNIPNGLCEGSSTVATNTNPMGIYSSSDQTVASIDASGNLIAKKAGTTTITYAVGDDGVFCPKAVDMLLTVYPTPDITLGLAPSVCEGTSNLTLPYSNPVADPLTYSINWITSGLTNVPETMLPPEDIPINIPSTAVAKVYSGVLTIKNAHCNRSINFSVQVKLIPHKAVVSIQ